MFVTPLQYLLAKKVLSSTLIKSETGINRSTLLRWKKGLCQPDRVNAKRLIDLYKEKNISINDEKYELDFNGCYDKTVEVANEFF